VTAHTWRLNLSVQAHDPEQDCDVPVVTGLLNTPAGGVQLALQVGEDRPVIVAIQDARKLSHNLIEAIVERLMITTDNLGDDHRESTP
jgi:hypothetical protein